MYSDLDHLVELGLYGTCIDTLVAAVYDDESSCRGNRTPSEAHDAPIGLDMPLCGLIRVCEYVVVAESGYFRGRIDQPNIRYSGFVARTYAIPTDTKLEVPIRIPEITGE